MIDLAVIERLAVDPPAPTAMASAPEWVETLMSRATAAEACAIVEHHFGALPLIERFFDHAEVPLAAVKSGVKLGALGLFTPTPDHGWGSAVIAGQPGGGMLRLRGEVRVSSRASVGSVVLVRLSDKDQRLVWLDHEAPGVEPRRSRTGGSPTASAPWWLAVEGAAIAEAHVSRPVTLVPAAELYERLERYVSVWALIALECARRTVRALRCAARTTRSPGQPEAFSASQLVAMDLAEVEIETELATAAARRHFARAAPHPSGLALALSSARALGAVAAKASELRDHLGLTIDGPLADVSAGTLTAHVGGAPMLENELGRALALGLVRDSPTMTLALVGYGKMGHAVDELAQARGLDVVERFVRDRPLRSDERTRRRLAGATLLDFSTADTVLDTVETAAQLSLNVVIGTTGWRDRIDDVRQVVETSGIGVVYAANFSVGVNVFYGLVDEAARKLAAIDGYDPFILDWHHRFKQDSPSGTALEIQRRIARHYGARVVPIASQRAGYMPSLHSVGFDSEADTIHLEHRSKNRQGLAEGALLAAQWIAGRSGFHEFREVLDTLLHAVEPQRATTIRYKQ